MKTRGFVVLLLILICVILSACAPSQEEQVATVTQLVANIFATQTATAPTATQTFTPSSTPTITPTPTSTPTATLTPTPTNTPTPTKDPSILLSDDFSDPTSGWLEFTNEDSTIEYVDGGYRMFENNANHYLRSTRNRNYPDVTIVVDGQKIGGPSENEYGVICRYKDENNFYLLSIGSDGSYGIFKIFNGKWTPLGSADWGFDDLVIKGEDNINHITATCKGDSLTLKVNGSTLMDVSDSDLKTGDIALYVGSYDTSGVDILFDNFIASRP